MVKKGYTTIVANKLLTMHRKLLKVAYIEVFNKILAEKIRYLNSTGVGIFLGEVKFDLGGPE